MLFLDENMINAFFVLFPTCLAELPMVGHFHILYEENGWSSANDPSETKVTHSSFSEGAKPKLSPQKRQC